MINKITDLFGKYPFFENKVTRIILIIIFLLSFAGAMGIIIYVSISVHDKIQKDNLLQIVLPVVASPGMVILFLYGSYMGMKATDKIEVQLERLRRERIVITEKIEKEKEPDIFQTIQLSLNQLNEYYTINKGQARSSFRFSIFSIIVGLVTILAGIWIVYFGNARIQLAFISGVSGLLLEFIGGAYFFMYKKSLEQVNFFFGQLIKIQDTMLAINLAKNITDDTKNIEMYEKIITSLLERSLK